MQHQTKLPTLHLRSTRQQCILGIAQPVMGRFSLSVRVLNRFESVSLSHPERGCRFCSQSEALASLLSLDWRRHESGVSSALIPKDEYRQLRFCSGATSSSMNQLIKRWLISQVSLILRVFLPHLRISPSDHQDTLTSSHYSTLGLCNPLTSVITLCKRNGFPLQGLDE